MKLIINTREKYPHWGAKKILPFLQSKYNQLAFPSAATVGNILKRAGYTVKRRRNPKISGAAPLIEPESPNHVWTLDFKGWWKTGDDKICEPFTVFDSHSRYLLYCQPVPRRTTGVIWDILVDLFQKYGLPERCRSDNGPPFASIGIGRMSPLSINLIKAGIIPEWTRPGKPQDNGRHERMHRTMKAEVALIPEPTLQKQKEQLKEFQNYYNDIRPHEALQYRTPSQAYKPSTRIWSGVEHQPIYSSEYILRKVDTRGQISVYGYTFFISERLRREYVGLLEEAKGTYKVFYGPIFLGMFDMLNGFTKF